MVSAPGSSSPIDRPIVALAALNFFLADARDGLGPFLNGFLATNGWNPFTLGMIATIGGFLGMIATPLFGALVDSSSHKRTLIILPVIFVTAAALWTVASPDNCSVFGGQSATAIAGAVVGAFGSFGAIYPVQVLDGVGAGLIGIATAIAVERILSGTGRFNAGLAVVGAIQGIGAYRAISWLAGSPISAATSSPTGSTAGSHSLRSSSS